MEILIVTALTVLGLYFVIKESRSDAAVCKNCHEKSITGIVNCTTCKEFNY